MAGKSKHKTPTLAEIRESLEKQLQDRGADVAHFQALLDDLMFYFQQEKKMQADIKKNGRIIKAISAAGKEYDRENPAVKQAALYNQRKFAILRELGLTTDSCRPPDEFGGDLG